MNETEMRDYFGAEQGARLTFDTKPGAKTCAAEVRATDAQAAMLALAMLTIRAAEALELPLESTIARLAVTVCNVAERAIKQSREGTPT